jgi:molecular chaperone DnaJ
VSLSLEDAILGCTRTLRGHFIHTCGACVGTGQRVLAKACPTCRGTGAIRKPTLFGWLWNEEGCPDCGGDGRQRQPCVDCNSTGQRSVAYRRRVRFAAGMRSGDLLSVPPTRHGEDDIGLELQVSIEPHPLFTLDENNVLRCEMPVNGYAWMTGRWVEVPTPDGLQQMRLNRDALVYRLGSKGFPQGLRGPRGDFIIKVVPVFPSLDAPGLEEQLERWVEASTRAAAADKSLPLGEWQRRLKRWQAQ